jgi:cystathionine gamma-synthase
VCESTSLIVHGTSLGGVETLIERRRRWADERPDIPDTLVRIAVGIEDVEDLWADLEAALATLPV